MDRIVRVPGAGEAASGGDSPRDRLPLNIDGANGYACFAEAVRTWAASLTSRLISSPYRQMRYLEPLCTGSQID
jgi:hypothetical protein